MPELTTANTIIIDKEGKPREVFEKEIDVKYLLMQREELEKKITELPTLKDKPDEETLIFWNNSRRFGLAAVVSIRKKIDDIDNILRLIDEARNKTP